MNKFRTIEIGTSVAFYGDRGWSAIYTDKYGYTRSKKMYSIEPNAFGNVVKIKGHNGSACRVFLDNGKEIEIGLTTHYHLDNNQEGCEHHRNEYLLHRD